MPCLRVTASCTYCLLSKEVLRSNCSKFTISQLQAVPLRFDDVEPSNRLGSLPGLEALAAFRSLGADDSDPARTILARTAFERPPQPRVCHWLNLSPCLLSLAFHAFSAQ